MKKSIVLIVMFLVLIPLFGCKKTKAYEGSIYQFGTIIKISIKAEKDLVETHYNNICDIFEHFDKISNPYFDYQNNVYAINHATDFIEVDDDLLDILNLAIEFKEITNGHFNILVGNVANVYKNIIDGARDDLSDAEISSYLKEINESIIEIDGNKVKINGTAKIDLGAIAKGYALKKVKEYILENGISEYIINCGASSLAMGEKSGGYFVIGIKYDEANKVYIKNYDLGCSSSNEQSRIINGKKIHHIVNPLTCTPSNNHEAVYLIGEDSAILDILSTAFMSMEIDEIRDLCNRYDLYYIVYNDSDTVYKTIDGVYYDSKTYEE